MESQKDAVSLLRLTLRYRRHQIHDAWHDDLAAVVLSTANFDWQFLTKRPQNLTKFYSTEILNRVWAGTTVKNQEEVDRRIPILRRVLALLRWLSIEPLLEPLALDLSGLQWVIIGGESGPKSRERLMDLAWMNSVIAQ